VRPTVAPPPISPVERGRMPTFSVVVAAFQAADTIAEALESALAQTFPAHEILVCDDGSTDDIAGAVEPFRERIRFMRQPNRGFAAARNALIEIAAGDFVVFLDADDVFLPERLEALGELAAARPDLDIVTTDAYFEQEGRIVGRVARTTPFPAENQAAEMMKACYLAFPAVRRERLLEIGGFDETLRIAADWDCWLQLLVRGARAGLVDEPLLRYRWVRGSLSDNRPDSLHERVVLLEKVRDDPSLGAAVRQAAEDALRVHRSRALRAEADVALLRGHADARRRLLRVARDRSSPLGARLGAGASALAPAVAGKLLRARERRAQRSRLVRPDPGS
jgi:hypothetical protein